MTTSVTTKGQVTIPKSIRDLLGIKPGSAVDFVLAQDGRVVLEVPDAPPRVSRFEVLRGIFGPGMTTDEVMRLTRGEDWGRE